MDYGLFFRDVTDPSPQSDEFLGYDLAGFIHVVSGMGIIAFYEELRLDQEKCPVPYDEEQQVGIDGLTTRDLRGYPIGHPDVILEHIFQEPFHRSEIIVEARFVEAEDPGQSLDLDATQSVRGQQFVASFGPCF